MIDIKRSLVEWMVLLVQERICKDIRVTVSTEGDRWLMRLPGCASYIRIDMDSQFYSSKKRRKLGYRCLRLDSRLVPDGVSKMHAPGCDTEKKTVVSKRSDGFDVSYDILGLAYWMMSRSEEIDADDFDLDEHGRFKATSSHAFRYGYLDKPVVDEWFFVLRKIANAAWPGCTLVQPRYEVHLTHDIDRPSVYIARQRRDLVVPMMSRLARSKDKRGLLAGLISYHIRNDISEDDPYNQFKWIMDEVDDAGIKSRFFFMAGAKHPKNDTFYSLNNKGIRRIIQNIRDRGFLFGVHPSYLSSQDNEIGIETARLSGILEENDCGILERSRMHFLRWNWDDTAKQLSDAGIRVDETMGYADIPGFRCGTSQLYRMIDSRNQEIMEIYQQPMILMDNSLDTVASDEEANISNAKIIHDLASSCRKVDGKFSMLWHNCSLVDSSSKDLFKYAIRI